MILGIDVGNSNISFGVFKNGVLANVFNLKTERSATSFEFLTFLEGVFSYFKIESKEIKEVRIASVVPEVERALNELFVNIYKLPVKFILPEFVPLKVNLKNPSEVGVDRLLNVFSAFKTFGSEKNILVIDFGTAITFDVGINANQYEGGIIFPGINLSLEGLRNGTSKLPKVSLKNVSSPVGKSTSEAINAGIFYGYAGMVNGCVNAIQREYESDFNIITTGGYGSVLAPYFDFEFRLDDNLILNGILNIL
jgi:type III pantothenate kinase